PQFQVSPALGRHAHSVHASVDTACADGCSPVLGAAGSVLVDPFLPFVLTLGFSHWRRRQARYLAMITTQPTCAPSNSGKHSSGFFGGGIGGSSGGTTATGAVMVARHTAGPIPSFTTMVANASAIRHSTTTGK